MEILGYEWYIYLGAIGIYQPHEELFQSKKDALSDGLSFGYPASAIEIDRIIGENGSTYVNTAKKAKTRILLHTNENTGEEKIIEEPLDK